MKNKVLVAIDVQREYVTPGRTFHISGIEDSLRKGVEMLQFARAQNWPIVHVQHLQDGDLFGRQSPTSDFVEGFAPATGEVVAVKGNYSSFSSPDFERFVAEHRDHEFLVIGYGTTMCCLATIVEGYHRGLRFALVEDACAARAARGHSEESMHGHAVATIETFARITTTTAETAVAEVS